MRVGLVVSIVSACFGFVACGGASCLSVLNYEPPHPHWQVSVTDSAAHPERAKTSVIEGHDYAVSIYPGEGQCTLAVKNASGEVLGESKGGLCLVALTAHARDTWSFEATSSAPNAEIQLAVANPVFPRPLGRIALGGAIVAGLGVLTALLSLVAGRRARPRPA